MALLKNDLVVRYQSDIDQIAFFVRTADEPTNLLKFFSISMANHDSLSSAVGEVGEAVVAFLRSRHQELLQGCESTDVSDGDSSWASDFAEVRLLIDRLGDQSTEADLEAIDILLNAAIASGDQEALEYRGSVWPGLRDVFVKRMSRLRDGKPDRPR